MAIRRSAEPNPALLPLEVLVGEWALEILHPEDPSRVIPGKAVFEWIEAGAFLLQHSEVPESVFPSVTAVFGRDDAAESFRMLYFDSRGVSRIYQATLKERVWTLWRDAPGFSQRYIGTFSPDGNTITGSWENSGDGSSWAHDFAVSYVRVR